MRTGVIISGAAHGALIALVVVGLPWLTPREREAIEATEVSFVTEAEFAAAQAAASAEAPRAEDAPAEVPAVAEPEPTAPAPEPEVAAPEPEAAEPEVAVEAPEAMPPPQAPAAAPAVPAPGPLAAVAPPRARPAPRVAPEPTPAPPEAARPAELPTPETAPSPEPEVVAPEQAPQAPPEAAPEPDVAEPTPPAELALTTSGRPRPRRVATDTRQAVASDVMEKLQEEIERERARQREEEEAALAAAATPPTEPSVTEPTAAAATSLPVGPPLTAGEKDGLKLAVQRCWNVPAGLRDAAQLRVVVGAELAPDGQVINASVRLVEPSPVPDGAFQQAYEAGRRALLRCSPYTDLPREKYAQWRNIEVVFNPEGMVSW